MTTVTFANITAGQAMSAMLPKVANMRFTSIGMVDQNTILLCGPRPGVREHVAALQALDTK